MAGPGIRYSELARVLSQHFRLTLAVPSQASGNSGRKPSPIGNRMEQGPTRSTLRIGESEVWPYERSQWDSLAPIATKADVVLACGDTLADFPQMTDLAAPIVIDGYDPHTLETLSLWAGEPIDTQIARHDERLAILERQCQTGAFFICGNERQRDWWLGLLEQQGRVNPVTYGDDPSLRRLIDVVPYGLPAEPPKASRPVLRGVWPGLDLEDLIVLWGGGLWEWLDPLTAIRAVQRLVEGGRSVRLVFPGTRHPNPSVPDMPIRAQAMALAEELGLRGQYVLFGEWVAHEDWAAVLLEADVGISLHPDTVEARLAARSRALDYIWSGLPMIVTQGDAISEVVEEYGLGAVVGFGDDAALAQAILTVIGQPRDAWQAGFARAQAELTWERAAQPLIRFCRQPYHAADQRYGAMAQTRDSSAALHQAIAQRDAEIARLQALVTGYEQGRLMRLMRETQRWRKRVGLP
jgi:glycosyltransferase involved in cell wall biosynthesis